MTRSELPLGPRRFAQWLTLIIRTEHVTDCIGLDGDGSGDYCCCQCACCPCWSIRCGVCMWKKPVLRSIYRFAWRENP